MRISSVFYSFLLGQCVTWQFYLLHMSQRILCLVVLKREIKIFLMKCWAKLLRGQVEKSHPSFKSAKYVLSLLSTKYNTTSAGRLCSNKTLGLFHTSDKGLSLQFLGIVCALFISKPLCQTGCPENTLACFLCYCFAECLFTTLS